MLSRLRFALVQIACCIATSGCGTFANTCWFTDEEGGHRVFGGVRTDWQCACRTLNKGDELERPSKAVWLLADLPFSFVGDTLTLPYTLFHSPKANSEPEKTSSAAPQD